MVLAAASLHHPGLTIALALLLGLVCQAVARHLSLPGLLLLLITGVLVGPDVAGWIEPESIRNALPVLVEFAVAIILFEGGMNLDLKRLRRSQRSIQLLITAGALVTATGGTLAAHYLMGWEWPIAVVFGTLVIVTGPTVIGPLLKRLKVKHSVATVLEAEGVLGDAIGAIAAAAALEYALTGGEDFGFGLAFAPLGFGVTFGFIAGGVLAWLLRLRNVVPEGLENVVTLAWVCALFHTSNVILHESGVAAVTIAGMVVGNFPGPAHRELHQFKEQLTFMLIGMLFILLAADVGLSDVVALGWPGVWMVVLMMVVIRPLCVFTGTLGSGLTWRERFFIGFIGPRGIVAAAVASLVATKLGPEHPAGPAFRALVFTVIAVTVASAGLFGGPLARLLHLKRASNNGWVILGAAALARCLARVLTDKGESVLCIDRNHDATLAAEEEGIRVIYGNGLEERTLWRAEIDTRAGAIGLSPNGEVNLLFATKAKREGKVTQLYVAMSRGEHGLSPSMIHSSGAEVLFDHPDDVEIWNVRLRRNLAHLEEWTFVGIPDDGDNETSFGKSTAHLLLVRERGGKVFPLGDRQEDKLGDRATVLIHTERREEASAQLAVNGWAPAEPNGAAEDSAEERATPDRSLPTS